VHCLVVSYNPNKVHWKCHTLGEKFHSKLVKISAFQNKWGRMMEDTLQNGFTERYETSGHWRVRSTWLTPFSLFVKSFVRVKIKITQFLGAHKEQHYGVSCTCTKRTASGANTSLQFIIKSHAWTRNDAVASHQVHFRNLKTMLQTEPVDAVHAYI
jgi:hypothetical protein